MRAPWTVGARRWRNTSLRARITVIATVLFSFAVFTGALVLAWLLRLALVHELDSAATKTGQDVAALVLEGKPPKPLVPFSGAVEQVQVVDQNDGVVDYSLGTDAEKSVLNPDELPRARAGHRLEIDGERAGVPDETLRVTAVPAGNDTVLVATGVSRIDEALRVLGQIALIGGPLAVLAMAVATWWVVGLALRPVAALRHGAEEISATGLADQRLPIPHARDEIHRLALTLNAMLDRIDTATARQRTFVGDAAHELRSPLASLRLQLEIAERLGPSTDWSSVVEEAMVDVDRLQRTVDDLLALARLDENAGLRRNPVEFDAVLRDLTDSYGHARVPVSTTVEPVIVPGDADALRRVATNLIDNAVRYASSGVQVRLAAVGENGTRAARLTVTDDGPGVPPAERERVFDRFYRTEISRSRETGGTGLGLGIVRDLVRAHGGTVQLAGNPELTDERGLVAVVSLPLSVPDEAPAG